MATTTETETTSQSFLLAADGGHVSTHPTCQAAVEQARSLGAESFEVYDEDDRQVYAVRPQPVWA